MIKIDFFKAGKRYRKEMIYNVLYFCFISFFTLILFGCSTSKDVQNMPPLWVYSPKEVYPESSYIVYVGYGPDRNTAEVSALNGLSSIFEQSIKSDTVVSGRMSEAIEDGFVAYSNVRDFSQEVLKQVNVDNLVGVEVKDFWIDSDSTWYGIAVLDKNQAVNLYKNMIEKNNKAINNLISSTGNDYYSISSYCAYDFAQEIANDNINNLKKIYVIDYNVAESLEPFITAPNAIAEKKLEIAKKIPIAINITGDDGKVESAFLDAFNDFGFSGSIDNSVRYIIKGNIDFNKENTSDGKTTKCVYNLESYLLDTKNNVQVFPINLSGRQSHTTYEKAKNRADTEIASNIRTCFINGINSYSGLN